MNAAAGEQLGTEETQNNNRGCHKAAGKWWVETLVEHDEKDNVVELQDATKLQCIGSVRRIVWLTCTDAGVFVNQQLHLDLFFCLDPHPESRLRKQKQVCELRCVSRGQEKNTQKQRTTEATPTSRLDDGRWKELTMHSVSSLVSRQRQRSRQSKERRKER